MILIFLLCMALGGPPPIEPHSGIDENGMMWEESPGLLPVVVAAESGDVFGEESLLGQKFAFFMQENGSNITYYMLPNLTQNLTA
jgi:hypothetical protein